MNLRVFVLAVFLITLPNFYLGNEVKGESKLTKIKPAIETRKLDGKAQVLADYLASHNSPLQNHSQDFIDAANKYNLDWRLVAAIAGVESTFGKFTPGGYNAYGWGVYNTQAIYFTSWTEGIFTVSKGLKENYIDIGLTDPYSINRVYAASPVWGGKVSYFMSDLKKFSQKYAAKRPITFTNPLEKTVGASAILALK